MKKYKNIRKVGAIALTFLSLVCCCVLSCSAFDFEFSEIDPDDGRDWGPLIPMETVKDSDNPFEEIPEESTEVKEDNNSNGVIGDLVGDMFEGFKNTANGVTNAIEDMFNSILWQDGTPDSGLSHFAKFGFLLGGLSLALGLGYFIIRKIRG